VITSRCISIHGLTLAIGLLAGCAGFAQTQDAPQGRFDVSGDRLIYDTTIPIDGKERDIRYADVDVLRDTLRAHPEIRVLELNSSGGGHYPSLDLAALVIDFELDTHVSGTCESSCVSVFLGGTKRTMDKGGRIGFHQLGWNDAAVEDYYNKHRERRGWKTPFEFAEWMYQDTQTETYNRLDYMVQRGVEPRFAIQTIRKPDTSMWFPYRAVLLAAGVLTD
jgi:hypothetical protein